MKDLVSSSTKTKVFALGGLGEVGKNMYCVQHGDSIIIIDSGVMFGDEYLPLYGSWLFYPVFDVCCDYFPVLL